MFVCCLYGGILKLKLLQGLRRYSKKQPSHVSLYLAFQLQYSPVQTANEHFATVLAPYPNWSDSVGHPELGFLKEQSIHYAAYIASIHLVAIRFCMLISAKHNRTFRHCSGSLSELIRFSWTSRILH
jgi:hypothetical protein